MTDRERYVAGLDLGQLQDYSALALLRVPPGVRPAIEVPTLKRWPLGTAYAAVGRDVARFMSGLVVTDRFGRHQEPLPTLVVDVTGVGQAVAELATQAMADAAVPAKLVMVSITGGDVATCVGRGRWHVAKRHLVSALSAVVHGGRLRVAREQPEAEALVREMAAFKAKISLATGNESYEAWRERDHDDLVLAVALAVWWVEKPRVRLSVT